jgi:hypothetical protein
VLSRHYKPAHFFMFKVTLLIKQAGEWVDGPVQIVTAKGLEEYSKKYEYFRVENATDDDIKLHIPPAFRDFFYNAEEHTIV